MTLHALAFQLKERNDMYLIILCVLSPVRNPPSEPSVYLSLPPKQPDKMGFDEVRMLYYYQTILLCVLYYSIFNIILFILYYFMK